MRLFFHIIVGVAVRLVHYLCYTLVGEMEQPNVFVIFPYVFSGTVDARYTVYGFWPVSVPFSEKS